MALTRPRNEPATDSAITSDSVLKVTDGPAKMKRKWFLLLLLFIINSVSFDL